MTTDDNVNATPVSRGGVGWSRAFWVTAGADVLLFLGSVLNVFANPRGQFDGLVLVVLLVFLGVIGVTMGIVALIRRPLAYGIALVLVAAPLLFLGILCFRVTS